MQNSEGLVISDLCGHALGPVIMSHLALKQGLPVKKNNYLYKVVLPAAQLHKPGNSEKITDTL